MSRVRRWIVMMCLCLSGGMIFLLPYLREVYYIPLKNALHLTNAELGALMSVFGTTAMLSYFPGGWLADRFSPRKLISLSLFATGAAGLYFATFPSYGISIGVHAFWGVSVVLTFWASMIKATRSWASEVEQGRAFGILESGRGITEVLTSSVLLAVFASLGSGDLALSRVVVLLSLANLLLAVMAWFTLQDKNSRSLNRDDRISSLDVGSVGKALQMPEVWLISAVILAAYSAYWGSYYLTPYATDVFQMTVASGGALGVGKMWIKPLAAVGAGFLADKIGASRAVSWSLALLVLCFGVFVVVPGHPDLILLLVVNTALASLAIFALRGIYFALLEEGGIPLAMTGTVTGIISVLGYTPDIFMPPLGGYLLDRYPDGDGYRWLFATITILCLLGLVSAVVFRRRFSRNGPVAPRSNGL